MFGYKMTRVDWVLLPVLVVGMGALAHAAFHFLGFFGIGLLGVVTGVVAVTVDLERGWPAGDYSSVRYIAEAKQTMSRAERAEWREAIQRDQLAIFVAKVASAGMIILGFGLFFMVQLPA